MFAAEIGAEIVMVPADVEPITIWPAVTVSSWASESPNEVDEAVPRSIAVPGVIGANVTSPEPALIVEPAVAREKESALRVIGSLFVVETVPPEPIWMPRVVLPALPPIPVSVSVPADVIAPSPAPPFITTMPVLSFVLADPPPVPDTTTGAFAEEVITPPLVTNTP